MRSRFPWRGVAVIGCLVIATAGLFLLFTFWLGRSLSAEPALILVPEGASASEVVEQLSEKRVVSAPLYRLYGFVDGAVSRPKTGEYLLRSGQSYREIARTIALGPARLERTIRIVEGKTADQIADQLLAEARIPFEETRAIAGASANRAAFDQSLRLEYPFLRLLPRNRSLEGYLFPDTYRVWGDQLPEGLIRKQLDEFEERFGKAEVTPKSAPLKSLDEAVILASIVEAEVREESDRRIVAGIFLNRLRDGMALQTDASLSYVTGSGRSRANAADLDLDSPYNSYKYRGLPPSPIGNPGSRSLQAVLDPAPTDYRYFLTDAEGKVYYARTLEEHAANRRKAGF